MCDVEHRSRSGDRLGRVAICLLATRRLADDWQLLGGGPKGDLSRAEEYLERAEQQGFTSQLLLHVINRSDPAVRSQQPFVPLDRPPDEARAMGRLRTVPDAAAQQAARSEVLERLRRGIKGPTTATELGQLLLQKASPVEGDPVAYYVILREALDKCQAGGDLHTALSAIDALAHHYDIDAWKLSTAALRSVTANKGPQGLPDLIAPISGLAQQAIAEDEHDQAQQFADFAVKIAQPTGNGPLQQRMQRLRQQVEQTKELYEASRVANERLQQDPEDRAAHTQLGRYLCLGKGDFAAGLPHLRRG